MKHLHAIQQPRQRARGVSLIEVMIGILIITFGLLGLITLQARAIQLSVSSDDAQRAALLADEIAATMLNSQTTALSETVLSKWAARVADPASGGLPSGAAAVVADGATAQVTITWMPPQQAANAASASYVTNVVLP